MRVEVLAVGTELLLGQIVNSNAAQIGSRLAEHGLDHFYQTVVGDNLERVAAGILLACSRSDAVIITGGIGPTQDDLTREAMCAAAGVPMDFDEEYATTMRAFWEERGREMPESNLRQAQYPRGAEMVPNPKGTAPGLRMRIGDAWVFALPGVPAEMIPMLETAVLPSLRAESGEASETVVSRMLRTWGESESRVGELLGDLFDEATNPTIAFLASAGEIKIRVTAKAATADEAEQLIAPVEAQVRERLGSRVFGADDDTIETVLFRLLGERGWAIGTAESMTGGTLAARLTSVPGASAVYRGSIIAYNAAQKQHLLGVPSDLVATDGVVSEGVATAMAEGGAATLGVDVCVAVTGVAGPETHGGRRVGTIAVAVTTPRGTQARTLKMPGDRERIRTYAATSALHLTRMALEGVPWGE